MEYDPNLDVLHGAPFRAIRAPRRFRAPPSSLRHELLVGRLNESDEDIHAPTSSPGAGPSRALSPPLLPIEDERAQEANWVARVYDASPYEPIMDSYERVEEPWVEKRREGRMTAWGLSQLRRVKAAYENSSLARFLDEDELADDYNRFLVCIDLLEERRTARAAAIEKKLGNLHAVLALPDRALPSAYISRNPLASSRRHLSQHELPDATRKYWSVFMAAFSYDYEAYIKAYGTPTEEQMIRDLCLPDDADSMRNLFLRMAQSEACPGHFETSETDNESSEDADDTDDEEISGDRDGELAEEEGLFNQNEGKGRGERVVEGVPSLRSLSLSKCDWEMRRESPSLVFWTGRGVTAELEGDEELDWLIYRAQEFGLQGTYRS